MHDGLCVSTRVQHEDMAVRASRQALQRSGVHLPLLSAVNPGVTPTASTQAGVSIGRTVEVEVEVEVEERLTSS